jgi:osmotically-inducible protein OsmY
MRARIIGASGLLRGARSARFRTACGAACLAAAVLALGGCAAVLVGGAATGAVMANDRRPPEVVLGDERVELTVGNRLAKASGDQAHVNVTSYNYTVLLTGEVPDAKSKEDAQKIASEVERVKGVVNELQVAGISSLAARGNDTYLTGRVKAAFVAAQKFSATHVKVVSEAGVVYLLGLVTRAEADTATDLARGIGGVQKVVRIFEYVQAPSSAQSAQSPQSSAPASR